MELNKIVSNPMLAGAIELMQAEDTPEHRSMFMEELTKADFMSPVILDPPPTEDAEGRLVPAPECKVQLPMLSTADGMKFFMAFTDKGEYDKWAEKNQKMPPIALKIEEYAAMILRREPNGGICPALGMVVNPYGANIILPREMLAGILSAKTAQAQQAAAAARQAGQFTMPMPGPGMPQN